MSSAAASDVPDMGKRTTMNLLLLGAIGLPGLPLAGGFAYFVRARALAARRVFSPLTPPHSSCLPGMACTARSEPAGAARLP